MKTFLAPLALCMALHAGSAAAQQDSTPPMSPQAVAEMTPLADAFFRSLQSGDSSKAFRELFAGTLMEGKQDELQTLITQTNVYLDAYGTLTSWSMIRSDCLSPTYCRAIFQVENKNGPMFYTLTVHRRAGVWMTSSIFLTDRGQAFFDLPN
ncbi:hypothetical protein [Brevundimonas lenta]|uniref:DUF4019 domain-containing protein n=1 Tax=Brevundimonas lenta TaxID=424796 RepID=A0A7W6JF35_9CAUL|nr:hypothetical protein [Brevundimonas lenta]MBB4083978.1 hypothetical protein [Brevundimonas lenta]